MAAKKQTKTQRKFSPDVIKRRQVSRAFNEMFKEKPKVDGRKLRRRTTLIKELKAGKESPLDTVRKVSELIEMGETMASLKKEGIKFRREAPDDIDMKTVQETVDAFPDVHASAWEALGIVLK